MAAPKPKTIGVSFNAADNKLLARLKLKLRIFQTTELLRYALRETAKQKGVLK